MSLKGYLASLSLLSLSSNRLNRLIQMYNTTQCTFKKVTLSYTKIFQAFDNMIEGGNTFSRVNMHSHCQYAQSLKTAKKIVLDLYRPAITSERQKPAEKGNGSYCPADFARSQINELESTETRLETII